MARWIWPAMSPSGSMTGMTKIITAAHPLKILWDLQWESIASCAAAPGMSMKKTCALLRVVDWTPDKMFSYNGFRCVRDATP